MRCPWIELEKKQYRETQQVWSLIFQFLCKTEPRISQSVFFPCDEREHVHLVQRQVEGEGSLSEWNRRKR